MDILYPRFLLKDIVFFSFSLSLFFLLSLRKWTCLLWRDRLTEQKGGKKRRYTICGLYLRPKRFSRSSSHWLSRQAQVSRDSLKVDALQEEDTIDRNNEKMWTEYINIKPPTQTAYIHLFICNLPPFHADMNFYDLIWCYVSNLQLLYLRLMFWVLHCIHTEWNTSALKTVKKLSVELRILLTLNGCLLGYVAEEEGPLCKQEEADEDVVTTVNIATLHKLKLYMCMMLYGCHT